MKIMVQMRWSRNLSFPNAKKTGKEARKFWSQTSKSLSIIGKINNWSSNKSWCRCRKGYVRSAYCVKGDKTHYFWHFSVFGCLYIIKVTYFVWNSEFPYLLRTNWCLIRLIRFFVHFSYLHSPPWHYCTTFILRTRSYDSLEHIARRQQRLLFAEIKKIVCKYSRYSLNAELIKTITNNKVDINKWDFFVILSTLKRFKYT